jgi:hypothetical protein
LEPLPWGRIALCALPRAKLGVECAWGKRSPHVFILFLLAVPPNSPCPTPRLKVHEILSLPSSYRLIPTFAPCGESRRHHPRICTSGALGAKRNTTSYYSVTQKYLQNFVGVGHVRKPFFGPRYNCTHIPNPKRQYPGGAAGAASTTT